MTFLSLRIMNFCLLNKINNFKCFIFDIKMFINVLFQNGIFGDYVGNSIVYN